MLLVDRRTRRFPPRLPSTEGDIMEPHPIEWGPAHLRDEPPLVEVESDDRPEDN